jgi:hypothetical protein
MDGLSLLAHAAAAAGVTAAMSQPDVSDSLSVGPGSQDAAGVNARTGKQTKARSSRPLSQEQLAFIKDHLKDMSMRAIAAELRCAVSSVSKYAKILPQEQGKSHSPLR